MLSVLHVLTTLNLGGAEKFTIELAKLQRAQGLDSQILNLGLETDFLTEIADQLDIPVITSQSTKSRYQRLAEIHRLFGQFDVVQIHSPRGLKFVAPVLIFSPTSKIIYTRHGLDPLDTVFWRFLHQFIRPRVDLVTFVTQSGYDVFHANHKWPASKMRVIENGVYIPQAQEPNCSLPIRYGSVGRMVELKGQALLLKAVDKLARYEKNYHDKMELHFFGSGPLEPQLKQQASAIENARIQFHGEESDIEKIYKDIDVLVVASETEGLSMVIIEAMARGIPVIATNVGGNPTLVNDQVSGVIVSYGDVESLAHAMKGFIDNPGLILDFGNQSRAFISKNYSLSKTAEKYFLSYQE